jgi:TDG/mug DNA glycosylase family protein
MSLTDILGRDLRVVIIGTIAAWHRAEQEHHYAGRGNQFWALLHESGLTPRRLDPADDDRLPSYGIGLTDLVRTERGVPGEPPVFDLAGCTARIAAAAPRAVAFVSRTAATSFARAAGERYPLGYGPLPWTVAGRPAFVLPGPSGANNGMPLPVRIALWRDLADFLRTLG